MSDPTIERVGSAYRYRWPFPEPVQVDVDDVRQKSGEWMAYMTVRYPAPGYDPHLFEGNHNLSALQGRTSLVRHLTSRVSSVDWTKYLEVACVLTIRAEREGEPFVAASDLPQEERPFWLIEPVVRVGLPTIIFGDGGAGKSTTALMLASTVLSGMEIAGFQPLWTAPVLYLDWETDQEEINDSLNALRTGHNLNIPDIYYRREIWPLSQTVRQVKKFIDEKAVQLTVVDSIGAACGGEPESAEVTLRFFQAVRSLGCACLCISHITKEGSKGKPFGSAYMHNSARLTFELRRHQLPEDSVMHLGLYHTKANKGGMRRPMGLRVEFGEGSIRFDREDIPRELGVALSPTARGKIRAAMLDARESVTVGQIVSMTGLPEVVVKARLSEMVKQDDVTRLIFREDGARSASRYALRNYQTDVEPA